MLLQRYSYEQWSHSKPYMRELAYARGSYCSNDRGSQGLWRV